MFQMTLNKRIWLSFIFLITMISLIVAIIYPISIQQALKDDSFELIEQEQLSLLPNIDNDEVPKTGLSFLDQQQASRSVGNLIVVGGLGRLDGDPVPTSVIKQMLTHAQEKKNQLGKFELSYKGSSLFYVTRQIKTNLGQGYLVSYMWDTYQNQMAKKLWGRLLLVFLLAVLISLGFSVWLTHYLKAPLRALGKNIEEISRLNWREAFTWNSGDEFQSLADQFEEMRQNLVHYDEAQKEFLQQASHELKTPIMVIQSYSQAVKDGVMPKGLDAAMDIISSEANRMEKRVKKLLYYTRIDSLKDETPNQSLFPFGEIAQSYMDRFSGMKPDIQFGITGENVLIKADPEQFGIILENLLENALRYAETRIELKAQHKTGERVISVTNDGPPIPDHQKENFFEPFQKGSKGQFGLGLAIVKRLVERHNGRVSIYNQDAHVTFEFILPFN